MKPFVTIVVAVLVFFVLYSPQPLLPTFAAIYDVRAATSGMLMTATLIPLAIAPLFYGYVLSKWAATTLLRWSLVGMGLSSFLFAGSDTFLLSLGVRFFQGLLIPAAITAMTTDISAHSSDDELQHNMSLFVAGTILGGLLGRVLAGVCATYWSWQMFYVCLAVCLLALAVVIPSTSTPLNNKYSTPKNLLVVFSYSNMNKLYVGVFCLFLCFVAVLNYVPFILQHLLSSPSEVLVGVMYSGFGMGVLAAINAKKLSAKLGSAKRAMLLGYAMFMTATAALWLENVWLNFILLFAFCGGNFLVHSVAAAEVNRQAHRHKSITNATYLCAYYSGGVVGSYVPIWIYQNYGNQAFVCVLLLIASIGLSAIGTLTSVRRI